MTGRLLSLLLVTLLASAPAWADLWYEEYSQALDELKAGNWDGAIENLNAALAIKGDPSARARTYGMNFVAYFPFYHLGVAYQEKQDYQAALDAFDISERIGEVKSDAAAYQDLGLRRSAIKQEFEADVEQGKRKRKLLNDALDEAMQLQAQQEISRALAVLEAAWQIPLEPSEEAELRDLRARIDTNRSELGQALRRSQRAQALADSIEQLVVGSDRARAAGRLEDAVALLRQALQLVDEPADRGLLEDAPAGRSLLDRTDRALVELEGQLTRQVRDRIDEEQRKGEIDRSLNRARELHAAASSPKVSDGAAQPSPLYAEALGLLQRVLALEPDNGEALELQQWFLRRTNELKARESRTNQIVELERRGDRARVAGDLQDAFSAYRELLFIDDLDASTRTRIWESYSAVNGELSRRRQDTRQYAPRGRVLNQEIMTAWVLQGSRLSARDLSREGRTDEAEVDYRPVQRAKTDEASFTVVFQDETRPEVECRFAREPSLAAKRPADEAYGRFDCRAEYAESPSGDEVTVYVYPQLALAAGQTFFRVTARDWTEKATSLEHVVVYLRPVYKQAWFIGLLVLSGLGLMLGGYGIRVRRRRALLRRHFNPYIAGAPVLNEAQFFGRERLMKRVLQTIHNNSILLFGERRIGKTSLQHRLKERLREIEDREYEFFPVYIDLQGVPEEKFFATLADDIFTELAPRLDGASPDPALHSSGEYQYREFVRDLRTVLKVLSASTPKKVKLTLLIDEVDELNAYDPRTNQRLRSLFMKSFGDNLVAVFSGVGITSKWESEGSPWYNFFQQIPVEPFLMEDARKLICEPIRGLFKLEHGVVERIIELTECRPYLIQRLCVSLVDRMHQEKRRRITIEDVDRLAPSAKI